MISQKFLINVSCHFYFMGPFLFSDVVKLSTASYHIKLVTPIHVQPGLNEWVVKPVFQFPITTHFDLATFSNTI